MSETQTVLALPAPTENALSRLLNQESPSPRDVYDSVVAGGLSGNSKRAYRGVYEDFALKLDLPDGATAIRQLLAQTRGTANALVSGYRDKLVEEGKSPATVNLHVSALKSIVKEAKRSGVIEWVLDVRGLKAKKYRDTAGPGHDAVKSILKQVIDRIGARGGLDPKGKRDLAILRLLYDTALRCFEVAGLDLEHVDFAGSKLSIKGKARCEREWVHLPTPTLYVKKEWVAIRGSAPGPLWYSLGRGQQSKPGSRLSKKGIYRVVVQYAGQLGLHVTPHGLRHCSISEVGRRSNGNLVMMAGFARHGNLNTTKTYLDNLKPMAQAAADLLSEE